MVYSYRKRVVGCTICEKVLSSTSRQSNYCIFTFFGMSLILPKFHNDVQGPEKILFETIDSFVVNSDFCEPP